MPSKTRVAIPALMLLLLAACAQVETKPAKPQETPPPAPAVTRQVYVPPATVAQPAAQPPVQARMSNAPFTDHTVIEFDVKSRELSDSARESIVALGGSAQRARQIVITGYCDRHTASNAKEVALFRAMAVRNELVNLGALEKNVRLKYVTAQAKHEVTIDLTEN